MIAIDELIDPEEFDSVPNNHVMNLTHLHYAVNVLRAHFKSPITVSSGYRSIDKHMAIYEEINAKRVKCGLEPVRVPMKSLHLVGGAADLYDRSFKLKKWVLDNLHIAERLDLYFEDYDATGGLDGGWLHLQIYAPASGKRFFKP